MFIKIKKAITNPEKIIPYFIVQFRKLQVRKVEKDGKVFYKYKGSLYPEYLNQGNAASYILDKAKKYCKGKGLDIGCGPWPFPGAIPIDYGGDQDAYNLSHFSDNSLDYIFSSHCLEHLDRWQYALKLWIRKLKAGGILFIYLPHESMKLWNRGRPWVGYGHQWIPTYQTLNKFLEENGMKILDYNPRRDKYWSFHVAAEKIKKTI